MIIAMHITILTTSYTMFQVYAYEDDEDFSVFSDNYEFNQSKFIQITLQFIHEAKFQRCPLLVNSCYNCYGDTILGSVLSPLKFKNTIHNYVDRHLRIHANAKNLDKIA